MFFYERRVHLDDTDSVGVLYFANQLKFAMEAFEEFLCSRDLTLNEIIANRDYLLPIVHAEADYSVPLRVGDLLQIVLWVSHIGNSSVHFSTEVRRSSEVVGTSKIVHAAISKVTKSSIAIPEELLEIFRSLHKGVKFGRNFELRKEQRESLKDLSR